ncbi:MAG: hypothetical protein JST85_22370 [Acidobacteria bacterium]|nr:hypothetical protein [Acidobacteriota bacterium]
MSQIIRKKCNGKEKHDNEFTRDELLRKMPVTRNSSINPISADLPNELVFKCRTCTEGRIVFTRSELEAIANQ